MQESGEMYLETILVLGNKNEHVRAVDIAEYMGISKPAVSKALAKYKEEQLIGVDISGNILLTDEGRRIAEKIYERHVALTDFLIRLGVDEETAAADACRIEHVVSDKSFEAMKRHSEKKTNVKMMAPDDTDSRSPLKPNKKESLPAEFP